MNRKPLLLLITLLVSVPVLAQDIWSADELDKLGEDLRGRVQPNNMAAMPNMFNEGGYFSMLLFREAGPGFAEQHAEWSDIYFVIAGGATLVTGGTLIDPGPNPNVQGPGELVGPRIEGGSSRVLGKGDIAHIPPGIPHHLLVESDEGIVYFLVKARPE